MDLLVNFYRSESGGGPLLVDSVAVPGVALQDGVFQVTLDLSAQDYAAVFPDA